MNAPAGDEPIGLDMLHMGKGLAWLNGEELEDTGLEKALYMMSVYNNVSIEANSIPTNAAQGVENHHRDGKSKIMKTRS